MRIIESIVVDYGAFLLTIFGIYFSLIILIDSFKRENRSRKKLLQFERNNFDGVYKLQIKKSLVDIKLVDVSYERLNKLFKIIRYQTIYVFIIYWVLFVLRYLDFKWRDLFLIFILVWSALFLITHIVCVFYILNNKDNGS